MEPNKNLENQFRDKLNARQIEPAAAAWDRLNAMLTVTEIKPTKKKTNWLLIAAGFVGLLFSGFVIYQLSTNAIKTQNNVVENKKMPFYKKTIYKNTHDNKAIASVTDKISSKKIVVQAKSQSIKSNFISTIKNTNVVQQNAIKSETQTNLNDIEVPIIIVSPEALLASVETVKPSSAQIPAAITVNVTSLLSQVNSELSQEFRETKFQKLKRNFKNVKVAMNARNNK